MAERTFGWIQDPGKIQNLKKVVELFDNNSKTYSEVLIKKIPQLISDKDVREHLMNEMKKEPLEYSYRDLVGTAFIPRTSAKCNGIIQAAIKGQKRGFIADWPADNFLRWAVSLGFVKWIKKTDIFKITKLGRKLSKSKIGSVEEYKIYESAFLSYPPVSRIILLLKKAADNNEVLTKFELGKKLGFIGEEGFTSISQNLFVKEICNASKTDKAKIRSNWEGDSDKYARMICSWLMQLKEPWIEKTKKIVEVEFAGKKYFHELQAYSLTIKGFEIRKMILGTSRYKKIPKIVYFEMLSTKGSDRTYLRTRRSLIINFLTKKKLSLKDIQEKLQGKGFTENIVTIRDDINGLRNIGLIIKKIKNKYFCKDEIVELQIPYFTVAENQKSDILNLMDDCREKICSELHEYLVLIPMSFDKIDSKLFEIKTIELFTEYCKFEGLHLGGSNKPDGIIYSEDYGIIIDTKSYKSGFNITAPERDKMKRYIEENQNRNPKHNKTKWWLKFPIEIDNFLFLFISGKFGGNFISQLKILSEQTNNTLGSALTSYVLLVIANKIINNEMNHSDFRKKISCLKDVTI